MRQTLGRIACINMEEMAQLAKAKTVRDVFDILKASNERQEKELVSLICSRKVN